MRGHRFSLMLYDYLEGTLSTADRAGLEEHLPRCRRCRRDLEELRESTALLAPARAARQEPTAQPAWDEMVESILRSTTVLDRFGASPPRPPLLTGMGLWLSAHRSRATVGVSVAVAVALLVAFLMPERPEEPDLLHAEVGQIADSLMNARVARYLGTSRVLLTGLANGSAQDIPMDLVAERRTSRELLTEARYLRRQPLDQYSAGVISDVERIMLTMANLPEKDPEEDLRIIQQGVDHRNLLFRVRMAEQAYRSRTFARTAGAR